MSLGTLLAFASPAVGGSRLRERQHASSLVLHGRRLMARVQHQLQHQCPGVCMQAWARMAAQQAAVHNQGPALGSLTAASTPQASQQVVNAGNRASPAVQGPTRMVGPSAGTPPAAAAVSSAPQPVPHLPQVGHSTYGCAGVLRYLCQESPCWHSNITVMLLRCWPQYKSHAGDMSLDAIVCRIYRMMSRKCMG